MNLHPDILIIGGGIIGVCTAYYLVKQGLSVTLIEKGEVAEGSSYGNAGLLVPSHSVPIPAPGVLTQGLKWLLDPESPFYIKPRLDLNLLTWLWQFQSYCREEPLRRAIPLLRDLHRASLRLYQDLIEQEQIDCHFAQAGGLIVFKTQAGYQKMGHRLHLLREYGLEIDTLKAETIRAKISAVQPDIVGGYYYREDAHVNPALLVRGLAERVKVLGVTIPTQTEVQGFTRQGHRISHVHTTQGDFQPRQVILAAGAWSTEVARHLGLNIPMQPAKGYSLTFKRPAQAPDIPLHFGESRVVATPMGPHLRFAGTLELAGFDPQINQRRIKAIRRAADDYLVGLGPLEHIETWRGYRPCPADGLPYIGRSQAINNLIIATGHSYIGLSLGAVTGKLVEQVICEEEPMIALGLMRVERFAYTQRGNKFNF